MSFKKFFNIRNARTEFLINEMSLKSNLDMNDLDDVDRNLNLKTFVTESYNKLDEFDYKNNKFDVYGMEDSGYTTLWFIGDPLVAARIEFIDVSDNSIQIKFINSFRHYK